MLSRVLNIKKHPETFNDKINILSYMSKLMAHLTT